MNAKSILAPVFLLACPLIAHAQLAPQTPPAPSSPVPPADSVPAPAVTGKVTLRFQFKPGMSRDYAVVMDMTGTLLTGQSGAGMPISQHMEMTLRQTVQEVRASDGAATVNTGLEALKIRMNGQEKVLPQSQLDLMQAMTTTVVTPAGNTLSTTLSPMLSKMTGGTMAGGAFNPTGLIETVFTLPAGPVAVGETWRGMESAATAAKAPTSTYSLKGIGLSGGLPTASIGRTLDGNLNTMTTKAPIPMKVMSRVTGTGETEFDTKEGTVLHQSTTGNSMITVVTQDPQTGTSVSYRMKLQTKIDVGQIFTVAVPNPAVPTPPAP